MLVFIDGATGRLMQLRFVASKSAFFEALEGYLQAHGRPVAFYAGKPSVFRVAEMQAKGGQGMAQFGRALAELNLLVKPANVQLSCFLHRWTTRPLSGWTRLC